MPGAGAEGSPALVLGVLLAQRAASGATSWASENTSVAGLTLVIVLARAGWA